ncbi:MAG: hypothetical protein LBV38_01620 [Alistipes sp.]|jgi:hypothetical protein|nr:hypothetical protein [Alistipes sp.]
MRRLFSILALVTLFAAVFAVTTGCDDGGPDSMDVELEQSVVTVYLYSDSYPVTITAGSGDYAVAIDKPEVADVEVELMYGAMPRIVIDPKAEGEATVTVADVLNGSTASCLVTVTKRIVGLRVTDIVTHVDADSTEAIEADLAADDLWVEGGGIDLSGRGPLGDGSQLFDCTFVDADNNDVALGTMSIVEGEAEWKPIYSILPINNQIVTSGKWMFTRGDEAPREHDMFVVQDPFTRMSPVRTWHIRLYEDLSEHYRAKYPEAGVRSVIRVVVSPGSR